MRSGVIAQKLGMTRIFTEAGEHVPVTVLRWRIARSWASARRRRTAIPPCSSAPARQGEEHAKALRGQFAVAEVEPKRQGRRVPRRAREPHRGRRRDQRRPFRRGPAGRRHRHLDRQGLRRRHEALEFRRPARHARRVGVAPLARFDRPAPGPRQGVQGQEDGRPHGRRAGHHAEPKVVRDRRRARPDHGRRARCPGAKGGWILIRTRSRSRCRKDAPTPGAFRAEARRPKPRPRRAK